MLLSVALAVLTDLEGTNLALEKRAICSGESCDGNCCTVSIMDYFKRALILFYDISGETDRCIHITEGF